MPYSHFQHLQLLRNLYAHIQNAFVEIVQHPTNVKKINEALLSVEAKIYIYSLDKLQMEKEPGEELVGDQIYSPDWLEQLKEVSETVTIKNEIDDE